MKTFLQPEQFLFVRFLESAQTKIESGAHRYGRLLQESIAQHGSVETLAVPVDRTDQIDSILAEARLPRNARLVIQLTPHFRLLECVQWSIALAKHLQSDSTHTAVLHDAQNLPIPLDHFLRFALYRRPRTLMKSLLRDPRVGALADLCRHGFRIKVFDAAQMLLLPRNIRQQVDCVPHFIEAPVATFEQNVAKQQLNLQGARLLTVLGFINPRKGNELAIDALQLLPKEYVLVFAGCAIPGQNYIDKLKKRIADKGLEQRVRFTGYLSEEDQARWIAATDLGLCLFRKVSASGSLSTWIAHERPVLASALPELMAYNVIAPGSLLIEPAKDPAIIATVIRSACETSDVDQIRPAISSLKSALSIDKVWNRLIAEEHQHATL